MVYETVKNPHIQLGQARSSAGQIIEFNDLAFTGKVFNFYSVEYMLIIAR
jgi:hypothetical protein